MATNRPGVAPWWPRLVTDAGGCGDSGNNHVAERIAPAAFVNIWQLRRAAHALLLKNIIPGPDEILGLFACPKMRLKYLRNT
jgi:hypothetical protein